MKNLNIGNKIAVVFGIVLIVATAITIVGLWQLDTVMKSNQELMATPLAKERLVSDWYRTIYGGSRRTIAIAKSSDSSLVAFFAADSAQGTREVEELMAKVQPLLTSPEEKQLVKEIALARTANNVTRAAVGVARAGRMCCGVKKPFSVPVGRWTCWPRRALSIAWTRHWTASATCAPRQ